MKSVKRVFYAINLTTSFVWLMGSSSFASSRILPELTTSSMTRYISQTALRTPYCSKNTLSSMRYSTSTFKPWKNLPMEAIVRDVRYDETFKILLGEEGAEHRAISFLNAVFSPQKTKDRIKAIKYLDGTLNSAIDRTLHFDVKIEGLCETYSGHRFIVEMQKARIPSHTNRWVYYGARELAAMGERNYRLAFEQTTEDDIKKAHKEHYQRLDPVKVVTILDFDSPATKSDLQNAEDILVHWDICERQSKDVASPLLSWTYVILPRFTQSLASRGSLDFTKKPLDAWLYLMTREDKEKVLVTKKLVSNDEAVAEGFHRVSHLTPAEAESLHAGQMAFASRTSREIEKFDEGKKAKAIEIARKMLSRGRPVEEIIEDTGLSKDEINELK